MEKNSRFFGILMPVSSLPSPHGIGTPGKAAYDFVDFLSSSKAKVWQMLPLNVTSYGDSPYQSPSSKGLNYYFIDLDILVEKKLLTEEEVENADFGDDIAHVNYGKLFENRIPLLKKAFSRFQTADPDFQKFLFQCPFLDFAFFMTLKEENGYKAWYEWPEDVKNYHKEIRERVLKEDKDTFLFYLWTQYEFLNEYKALKEYANSKGILLMGDMPLYLAYDSAEAYLHPQLFLFDKEHVPTLVAGCPPDSFSQDGQLWGNPIYHWKYQKQTNYEWFNDRIAFNLSLFDLLRIDHFRGFAGYYVIPFGMRNARIGRWVPGPGFDFFRDKVKMPIIAEDLGFLDKPVHDLINATGYPGMKVLQFAFDGNSQNEFKPSNSEVNYICFTGTHDNDTTLGYLISLNEKDRETLKKDVKKECDKFLVPYKDGKLKELASTIVELCLAGITKGAIVPIQDMLLKDGTCRMNTPSLLSPKNWVYRVKPGELTGTLADKTGRLVEKYNRG